MRRNRVGAAVFAACGLVFLCRAAVLFVFSTEPGYGWLQIAFGLTFSIVAYYWWRGHIVS